MYYHSRLFNMLRPSAMFCQSSSTRRRLAFRASGAAEPSTASSATSSRQAAAATAAARLRASACARSLTSSLPSTLSSCPSVGWKASPSSSTSISDSLRPRPPGAPASTAAGQGPLRDRDGARCDELSAGTAAGRGTAMEADLICGALLICALRCLPRSPVALQPQWQLR